MNSFKLSVIGKMSCGKTSFILRLEENRFVPKEPSSSTLKEYFPTKYFEFGGIIKKVSIWDTGCQEKYGSMVGMFYRAANGVFIMFDLNNQQSLYEVEHWYKDAHKIGYRTQPIIFLIGNKRDLQQRCSEREILKISKKLNKIPIYYCSALNGNGCDVIFNDISNQMAINGLNEPIIQTSPNTIKKSTRKLKKQKSFCLIE